MSSKKNIKPVNFLANAISEPYYVHVIRYITSFIDYYMARHYERPNMVLNVCLPAHQLEGEDIEKFLTISKATQGNLVIKISVTIWERPYTEFNFIA